MPRTSWAYRTILRLGVTLAPKLGWFNPRLRSAIRARRDAGERLLDWARSARDVTRPLVWFHASSVGEGLQAESVIVHLRRQRPDCQVIYTHFSPSAETLAARLPVDAADYLPYDLPGAMGRLLRVLEPHLLVFSKLDLWPELSTLASTSGTEVAIVAATVSPGSGRRGWPARALLAPGYQIVAAAAAISTEDATRLADLGVVPDRIRVLGDPRYDSVIERVRRVPRGDPLLRFGQGAPTLVAGSTWPRDEAVLLRAFAALHLRRPDARLILVPHEPTKLHLRGVERRAVAAGLPMPVRLSRAQGAVPILLVDRVGVLASLYGAGSMAYVGGGFGTSGLHSVLEPAAWGVPVTFGPRWADSRDADLLLKAGAAAALPGGSIRRAAAALRKQWEGWILDERTRQAQGIRARQVVERGIGASERNAAMLVELISSRPLRRSPRGARSGPPSTR
ncbi:MAG TPA: glycosyltransferase N-terminal domain-containing protein [Gemmatimonadales bacterium]|nr:glycosyltransferase N-terminal domain-containing protein [Gemmatimonadales bacterium]